MNISITGRHHMELTDALKAFIEERFDHIAKHSQQITNCHVICEVQKNLQMVEATLHIPGAEIHAKSDSENMYKSIDLLIEKLIKQIDKYREKHGK